MQQTDKIRTTCIALLSNKTITGRLKAPSSTLWCNAIHPTVLRALIYWRRTSQILDFACTARGKLCFHNRVWMVQRIYVSRNHLLIYRHRHLYSFLETVIQLDRQPDLASSRLLRIITPEKSPHRHPRLQLLCLAINFVCKARPYYLLAGQL